MVEPLPQAEPAGRVFPPDPTAPAEQSYRSLSVLALVGFGLAALYAAIVLFMGAYAFFSGKPLLLSGWSLLVPLVAVGLCLLAGWQIRHSEGTLAGDALASWGWKLGVFVGLGYWAYNAAVYFAVRQQAEAFAKDWLELLARGELDKAARRTLPPAVSQNMREDDPRLGEMVDLRVGRGAGAEAGVGFRQSMSQIPFVRKLLQAGDGVDIQMRGVRNWTYEQGGYLVVINAHVKTPEAEFPVLVSVHSGETDQGRQWYVKYENTYWVENEVRQTDLGRANDRAWQSAAQFLGGWLQKLRENKIGAFVDTLPAEDRKKADRSLRRMPALALAAGGPAAAAALPDPSLWARYRRFVDGDMVRPDERLRVAEALREQGLAAARKRFEDRNEPLQPFTPERRQPTRQRKDNTLTFGFDHAFSEGAGPRIMLIIDVSGNARVLDDKGEADWRIAGVRVTGVVRPEQQGAPAPGPGGPPG